MMSPSSPSSRTAPAAPAADPVVVFMVRLARSPAPRSCTGDPAILVRRAPLVAGLARVRARERRLLGLTIVLEILTFAAAAIVVRGAPLAHLRGLLEPGLQHLGLGPGLVGVALMAAALALAAWTSGVVAAPSR